MKPLLILLVCVCASLGLYSEDRPSTSAPTPNKYVVEYTLRITENPRWTLYHFEALNSELAQFLSRERGFNTKCLVVPQTVGYAIVWMRSDWEEPISEAHKKKADEIIHDYLSGAECARITKQMNEAGNPPNQAPLPTPMAVTPPAGQVARQP